MVHRPHKDPATGMYNIQGHRYQQVIGSRQQVWHGTAHKTPGLLTKSHLMMNKWGRIVSKKKHASAKKEKRLQKHGFYTQKGKFGFIKKKGTRKELPSALSK